MGWESEGYLYTRQIPLLDTCEQEEDMAISPTLHIDVVDILAA